MARHLRTTGVAVYPEKMEIVSMVDNDLPPIHPGEFLAEILDQLELSPAQFARAIGVSPTRISSIIDQSRPVTPDLALLFGRALGQSPQYWLNLQEDWEDVEEIRHLREAGEEGIPWEQAKAELQIEKNQADE